jgi:hypothetical protein
MNNYNNTELMNQIAELALDYSGTAMIHWKTANGDLRQAPAERSLLGRHLYLADAFRKPKSYPRQRNYFGLYYFAQTKSHVWHESLNEANMMAFLDHTEQIVEIASQPMKMVFADGSWHVPDLLALHSNHRQVVYDIKPSEKITSRALAQFAKTLAVCQTVGWGYQVLNTLPQQMQTNLTHLSYFKHPLFHPHSADLNHLLESLAQPMRFDKAAGILCPGSQPHGRSALFHLLWLRTISTDLNHRIDSSTLIERNPDARA